MEYIVIFGMAIIVGSIGGIISYKHTKKEIKEMQRLTDKAVKDCQNTIRDIEAFRDDFNKSLDKVSKDIKSDINRKD